MGIVIFVYECEYPCTGGINKGPAPWGQTVHSPIRCGHGWSDSMNGSAVCDPLATPGRRQEDKPCCKVKAWRADCALWSHS